MSGTGQFAFSGEALQRTAKTDVERSPQANVAGDKDVFLTNNTRATSRKADRQEIFLPVSGFVWLFREEMNVVNHPAFQRLGRIYQLVQSYVVFRGATHKRLEHMVGALHVVHRMIAAVTANADKIAGEAHCAPPLTENETKFVRLGTLLHDIGHMAARAHSRRRTPTCFEA